MKPALLLQLSVLGFLLVAGQMTGQNGDRGFCPLLAAAYGADDWKKEFEDICGNTDESMKLSEGELKGLIARCDRLKPLIETLEETPRKIYLKKLQTCRGLLVFVLEAKGRK